MRLAAVLLLALASSDPGERAAIADQESAAYPYVVANVDRNVSKFVGGVGVYFKMSPDPKRRLDRDSGLGFAYRVEAGEQDSFLWRTEGWYSFRVFLAANGRDLVRLGDWPRGNEPSPFHLAVAFYRDGVLVKEYSTADLIKDVAKVEPSVSHYEFLAEETRPGFVPRGLDEKFELTTIDGIHYVFRVSDGAILSPASK